GMKVSFLELSLVNSIGLKSSECMSRPRFRKIVVNDYGGKQDQEDKSHLVDTLFYFLLDVTAHDAFNQQHQHQASIKNRNWEQIEDGEVDADECRDHQHGHESQIERLSGGLANANRSTELPQRHALLANQSANQLKNSK